MLDDAESVDVERREPGAEGRLVAGADGAALHPRDRRMLNSPDRPRAALRQRGGIGRLRAVRPQPAGMVVAHQALRVPRDSEPAVGQYLHRGGAQIVRQVDQHEDLLPGYRMIGAEIGAELAQPYTGQRTGAAVIPADLHVAVHDARTIERSNHRIGIVIRHRKRLRHGTLLTGVWRCSES